MNVNFRPKSDVRGVSSECLLSIIRRHWVAFSDTKNNSKRRHS